MLLADFKELDSPEKDGIGDGRTVDAVGVGNVKVKWTCKAKRQSLLCYMEFYTYNVPISGIPPTRIPPSGMTPFHQLLFLMYFMRIKLALFKTLIMVSILMDYTSVHSVMQMIYFYVVLVSQDCRK